MRLEYGIRCQIFSAGSRPREIEIVVSRPAANACQRCAPPRRCPPRARWRRGRGCTRGRAPASRRRRCASPFSPASCATTQGIAPPPDGRGGTRQGSRQAERSVAQLVGGAEERGGGLRVEVDEELRRSATWLACELRETTTAIAPLSPSCGLPAPLARPSRKIFTPFFSP